MRGGRSGRSRPAVLAAALLLVAGGCGDATSPASDGASVDGGRADVAYPPDSGSRPDSPAADVAPIGDGASRDGTSRDGASRDGTSRDGGRDASGGDAASPGDASGDIDLADGSVVDAPSADAPSVVDAPWGLDGSVVVDAPYGADGSTSLDAGARDTAVFPDAPAGQDGAYVCSAGDGGAGTDGSGGSCTNHHDCSQGAFCAAGRCTVESGVKVYHCGKKGCPPGRWCVTSSGARSTCARNTSYACSDACDCGPGHCCMMISGVGKRCVRDLNDPWHPAPSGTTTIYNARCPANAPTYCCGDPSCRAGKAAAGSSGTFACYSESAKTVQGLCEGKGCQGSSCNCAAGQSCVDTLARTSSGDSVAPPGKACGLFRGGSCVSDAAARAVFGFKASEVLSCCTACGSGDAGKLCEAGTFTGVGRWGYQRLIARCGPSPSGGCVCGDDICCASEVKSCAADCRCGNSTCDSGETASSCAVDCAGGCGDGRCTGGETASSCAEDCAGSCEDSSLYTTLPDRVCGDGTCSGKSSCDWTEVESCRTCPQDCGTCRWQIVHDKSRRTSTTTNLSSVWGSSASDVFAVGGSDAVYHYDGSSWTRTTLGGSVSPDQVWGSSASDVFVVGANVGIYHYDGSSWTKMTASGSWPSTSELNGLWGSSASDVFATGQGGLILHYDGSSWTGTTAATSRWLYSVWGSSASDVFAVGDAGTIVHYDGSSWKTMSSGTKTPLWGVWASSGGDAFAVGSSGVILRYDGSSWKRMTSATTTDLYAVWGSSASDVYAVGRSGAMVHYDGSSWKRVSSGASRALTGVWGSSASDVYAVGLAGTVVRGNRCKWSLASVPSSTTSSGDLRGVWASSAGDAVAVGTAGNLHFESGRWTRTSSTRNAVAVWGTSPSNVFAVRSGYVGHYDGSSWSWSSIVSSTSYYLLGIWGRSATEIYATGNNGAIYRYDGSSWTRKTYFTRVRLYDAWGPRAGSKAFAVGYNSAYVRHVVVSYDGTSWGGQYNLARQGDGPRGVWGSSASDVYIVASTGHVHHYDGTRWTTVTRSERLYDVWGRSASDIVAVGASGVVLRYDGSSWKRGAADLREAGSTCPDLNGIYRTPPGPGFIVGDGELVLRRP